MNEFFMVSRESLGRALCVRGETCVAHMQAVDKIIAKHELWERDPESLEKLFEVEA